jgi:TPR repeat protein
MRRRLMTPAYALLAAILVVGPASPAAADIKDDCLQARRKTGGWQICRRAIGTHPKDADVRRNYAISLSFGGLYDSAVRQYEEVTRLAPKSHRAQYELAWIFAFKRLYRQAEAPIEKAMMLKPKHLKYMRLAAIIFAANKHQKKRFAVVKEAAEMGDQILMFELAFLYADGNGVKEDLSQTLIWLIKAAKKGHVLAMDRLATAYLNGKLGAKKDRAKADYWARKAHEARNAE